MLTVIAKKVALGFGGSFVNWVYGESVVVNFLYVPFKDGVGAS